MAPLCLQNNRYALKTQLSTYLLCVYNWGVHIRSIEVVMCAYYSPNDAAD